MTECKKSEISNNKLLTLQKLIASIESYAVIKWLHLNVLAEYFCFLSNRYNENIIHVEIFWKEMVPHDTITWSLHKTLVFVVIFYFMVN